VSGASRARAIEGGRRGVVPLRGGDVLALAVVAAVGVLASPRGEAAAGPPRPVFVDVASEAGIRFRQVSGSPEKNYIFEAKGGGLCLLDYDGDGLLDIFFVQGNTLEDVQRGVSHGNALYRAEGDGTYTDVTEKAGVFGRGWGMGCTVGDYDGDGEPDIYVLGLNGNTLYRNTGEGRFEDTTERAGLKGGRWSTSAAFVDYDRDGDLDLYVANNIEVDVYSSPLSFPGPDCNYRGTRVMCGPRGLPGALDAFYRNDGDGTFTDVTVEAGLLERAPPRYGLGVAVGDVDNDGWPDIYVADDSTPSYLYLNRKDGTFEDVALLAGVAVSDDGMEQAGMGVDLGDYDDDGWLDIVKSNFAFENSNLYHNDRNGAFTDQSLKTAGIGLATRPLVTWGTKFLDYDNDGRPDIVVAAGHVYPHLIRNPVAGEHYDQPRLLFRNLGDGRFADVSRESGPGIRQEHSSRGLAIGDLDNDGDIDVVIVNIDSTPSILRNDGGNAENWLTVTLRGTVSNRMGLGARVSARTGTLRQIREATTSGSIFSASDSRVHFGLGSAERTDLEIRWPSGRVQRLMEVPANQFIEVYEAGGGVRGLVPRHERRAP
jgi:enediyne biosynthesis protein E4